MCFTRKHECWVSESVLSRGVARDNFAEQDRDATRLARFVVMERPFDYDQHRLHDLIGDRAE
jgi:hypothetical protein